MAHGGGALELRCPATTADHRGMFGGRAGAAPRRRGSEAVTFLRMAFRKERPNGQTPKHPHLFSKSPAFFELVQPIAVSVGKSERSGKRRGQLTMLGIPSL